MRFLFLLFVFIGFSVFPAWAADDDAASTEKTMPKLDAPIITYAQKVEIVIPVKRNPMVMTATIEQAEYAITLSLTVHNSLSVEEAKQIGKDFLIRTKNVTLDDPPEEDKPGEGLYDYTINIVRANGKTVIEGIKKADDDTIDWSK